MLDAVRIAGRWIRRSLLAKLTARSQQASPPPRWQLVEDFCRWTHWRNRKGEFCVSTANVALKRLEKQGLVRLPPPQARPAAQPRRLRDDGLPLPPLPKRPKSLAQISNLRLHLIEGPDDPQHLVWNRLISREHSLGGAPLVGCQLRYLIVAGENDIFGAIGFGPPSFYLSCRDCWIGWDAEAMAQNRSRVIGLSRFLIRPGLHCSHLTSACYRLALQRVREDWLRRYGVQPLLVETYVDRGTHTGSSLLAANWLRIGQSQGRGRSSPKKTDRSKSLKDVWVWQWDPQARAQLQARSLPLVAPRSVFSSSSNLSWVQEELDGLNLGHLVLERRMARMLEDRWAHPERSFFSSFMGNANLKAAYSFLENPRAELNFSNLLSAHCQNTRRRMAAESVVIMPQDTTALSYNSLEKTTGLGSLGDNVHSGRGLLLHTLLAFRLDGIPLGAAAAELWARDQLPDTTHRNGKSIDQKESVRWVNAFQTSAQIARQMPQTMLISCGDRESDIIEIYDRSTVAPPNLFFLVRAQHDRVLDSGEKLSDLLAALPCGGTMDVRVPRGKDRPARTATLELRWAQVSIQPPHVGCKKSWGALSLWVLQAKEIDPPQGAEAIDWILLTNWKIDSLKTACRLVRWYALRWGIECWHQVLKDVCKVEKRQMKSAQALGRALGLDMIVAWRVLLSCRLGKDHPNLSASVLYSPEELAILEIYKKKTLRPISTPASPSKPPEPPPKPAEPPPLPELDLSVAELDLELQAYRQAADPALSGPIVTASARALAQATAHAGITLREANCLTAQLAGFVPRKAYPYPGPKALARGWMILAELVRYERMREPRAGP